MVRKAIKGKAKGAGFGAKAETRKMMSKKSALTHDLPPGFESRAEPGKTKSMPPAKSAKANVAKKAMPMRKASKPQKTATVKIKKKG